ncbi:hypothetical protein DERP_004235 [Dermatophagoides pteronyssinus]|uniref:Uncharacterized protein n=1 Tax=Dermatophagoides pteronyssinus TaxID=6956 RepID=A0ABQ8J8L4_DERPT|nr:hypothetical protein DERP_004235 [Dermatophagoides pteronyssinus]
MKALNLTLTAQQLLIRQYKSPRKMPSIFRIHHNVAQCNCQFVHILCHGGHRVSVLVIEIHLFIPSSKHRYRLYHCYVDRVSTL